MSRILPFLMIVVAMAAALAACTRDEGKTTAQATATPAAKIAAPAPQAQASGTANEVEELYVDLDADPDEGPPPLTVKFTSTIEDATGAVTYSWDFGDGSAPGTEANPTHVFQKPGEYTATLSVKDSKGTAGSEDVDILVESE